MEALKACVGIGDIRGTLLTQVQYSYLQCSVRKEDTGWIISLGLTDPSCRAKNTSHFIILLGLSVSLEFSP